MNVVQCLSHSIESHDMLKLYASIGVNAFDIGGYIDPAHPHDPKRPAVDMPLFPELKAAVDGLGTDDNLGNAQAHIPEALLDWADVIVFHHYLDRLWGQWDRISRWLREDSAHRVIWRTVGQSVEHNERAALAYRNDGLEIVRYSPKERNIPGYVGEDALIRFAKDPADYGGWQGTDKVVLNIAQHDERPHGRDVWLNWSFWEDATRDLPNRFAGPYSEKIGGLGQLTFDEMRDQLRACRAYLYTGTQPASYTLGLIEAMMTGIPVLSIAPKWMTIFEPYGPQLFEGHELAPFVADTPDAARAWIEATLAAQLDERRDNGVTPRRESVLIRQRAIDLFGIETIGAQWADYLDTPAVARRTAA